jgi:hypothetical protein
MRFLKVGSRLLGAALITLLLVSIYATELTRVFVHSIAESPLALPPGVDIRYSDRLVATIGLGAFGGRAQAVTLGHVIVVPTYFENLSDRDQRRIIRHELAHVQQRTEYGRFYLPVYGFHYLLNGYGNHPLERQARAFERAHRERFRVRE